MDDPNFTQILVDEPSFQAQLLLMGSHLPLLVVLYDVGQLLIHEGHVDFSLGASSSKCGQLGPNLAIPIAKFGHPILVTMSIPALDLIFHCSQAHYIGKMDGDHDDDASSWSSGLEIMMMIHPLGVLFTHITAQGTHIK